MTKLSKPLCALLLLAGLATQSAQADELRPAGHNATWQKECGTCHVAYPPSLLPAASWREMMNTLDRHFGTDASLEAAQAKEILNFLTANAGRRAALDRDGKPLQRITETNWFRHEHDEVPARLWKDARVKSPANCAACHQKAEAGDYSERSLRLPR
ncbi:diheme cytochrome c [Sulfuritortus calidifontis]|uniref:Diheme cytochrome c n=1 Tax=Sulfuritortus calidifontis TaxID=1914471 RepID=A0A4R3JWU2_9PROT|nr:diheme cytochrome c [Sulfuritortus calidifontis]TCS70908.1 diheme cytochrome c [Sulfuritortus calidifontis]